MEQTPEVTYWSLFWTVVLMWHMIAVAGWIHAQIFKYVFRVKTIWGHKLNFLDCCLKGPGAMFWAFTVIGCPEHVERMKQDQESHKKRQHNDDK